ncbi:hypothetical protein Tco_0411342 [Tanacetum coccineum]
MSSRRPSILNRSSTQTTELPTQEDQIRGYRAMTRGRYQAASATRRLVYMFRDMVLSIDDFHNHVEVAIQTHGYDTWQRDHLTTTGFTSIPESEKEWENPFAAKRGEDHTVLHLSKNEEKDDNLPYPKFRKFKQLAAQIINKHEEHTFPTAADAAESSTSYQPPPDAIIGPAVYPPARQNPQPHINQTISLVILREKVIPFMEDMMTITTHSGHYYRHGRNPE